MTSRNEAIINRLNSFELKPVAVSSIVPTVKKDIPEVYINMLGNMVDSYARLEQYRLWSPENQSPELSLTASELVSYLDLIQDVEDCNEEDCVNTLIAAGLFVAGMFFGAAVVVSQFILPEASETLLVEALRINYRFLNAGADEIVEWALTDGVTIYDTFTLPAPNALPQVASFEFPVPETLLGQTVQVTCTSDELTSSNIFGSYKITYVNGV